MLYAFDGTWNRSLNNAPRSHEANPWGESRAHLRDTLETNVRRFAKFYGVQDTCYQPGVGTRYGPPGRVGGGLMGAGARHRVRSAYIELCKGWKDGDHRIDVIGFSRGAALAVHFCNVVQRLGIRDVGAGPSTPNRWDRDLGWISGRLLKSDVLCHEPEIHFVGLWDSVSSFGVPIWPFRNRTSLLRTDFLPEVVQSCVHAMALDEYRRAFSLIRPTASSSDQLYEVWFRGVHSNIGGGYEDRGLSDIALAWMMEQAVSSLSRQGLEPPAGFERVLDRLDFDSSSRVIDSSVLAEALQPDADGVIQRPMRFGALKRAMGRRNLGHAAGPHLVHHSVGKRTSNLVHDHRGSNRQVVRRLPYEVFEVMDAPSLMPLTRTGSAIAEASLLFASIPTRARPWLMLEDGEFVYRGDDWLGVGSREDRWTQPPRVLRRETFEKVISGWIVLGRPEIGNFELRPEAQLAAYSVDLDGSGTPLSPDEMRVQVNLCIRVAARLRRLGSTPEEGEIAESDELDLVDSPIGPV